MVIETYSQRLKRLATLSYSDLSNEEYLLIKKSDGRQTAYHEFNEAIGARYRSCSFDNYTCDSSEQSTVVENLKAYALRADTETRKGRGVIL